MHLQKIGRHFFLRVPRGYFSSQQKREALSQIRDLNDVCFLDYVNMESDLDFKGIKFEKWPDQFAYEPYLDIWGESYRLVYRGFEKLSPELRFVFEPYFHDQASELLKYQSLVSLLEREDKTFCFCVPERFVEMVTFGRLESVVWGRARETETLLGVVLRKIRSFWRMEGFWPKIYLIKYQLRELFFTLLFWNRNFGLKVFELRRSIIRNLAKLSSRNGKPKILYVLDDSGTNVNWGPSERILKALKKYPVDVHVVTGSHWVNYNARKLGVKTFLVRGETRHLSLIDESQLTGMQQELEHLMRESKDDLNLSVAFSVFIGTLPDALCGLLTYQDKRLISELVSPTNLVFTVNENLPMSILSGRRQNNLGERPPWYGFFPILLGKRPDCEVFPADHSLVYGEHLRELMNFQGRQNESIQIVGTTTYDSAVGRFYEEDYNKITKILSWDKKKKLVLVLTEGFNNPMVEMEPILKTLGTMDVHVVLKLHPSDSFKFFKTAAEKYLAKGRFDVINKCDIDALVHISDLMVCIISNIIVKGALLKTPNIIFDFSGKSKPLNFADEGLCFACYKREEIKPWIEKMLYDEETLRFAEEKMSTGAKRFCGPGDGMSHERIAKILAEKVMNAEPKTKTVENSLITRLPRDHEPVLGGFH